MKQKLIFRLFMIGICVCAVYLCLYGAQQDDISFSPYQPESVSAAMLPAAQTNNILDIDSIFSEQDTGSVQDSDIIQYTAHTTLTSPVAIFMYSEKRSMEAVNDKIIYESVCTYPHVIIDGNENAAAKINADIQTMIDSFYANMRYTAWAKDEYEEYYNANAYIYYRDKLIFSVARADSNVISFHITHDCYTGGAHGMDYHTGVNYDTRTGEKIDFTDLCADADAFHQNTLAFLQNLDASNFYQSIIGPDKEIWAESRDLEGTLYQDGRWYLSTSGLVFFSNPYELGPFYAGAIEFTIPYADLEEMDFQEQYAYDGTRTIHLQTEEVCFYDLNDDGQDEEIQFYIEQPGSASTNLHFIINGVDYALQHEQLAGQFSDDAYVFCWTKCFLYDMDTEDDAIEIAFQMNGDNPNGDGVIPTTFFYRYEKDASLTYLGKAETAVTDPSVVFDFMPEYDTLMENKTIYAG